MPVSGAHRSILRSIIIALVDGHQRVQHQQTKWGVVGLTKSSAGQLGRWNITVNCIAPGVIATDEARFVTGQVLVVDGGNYMRPIW